MNVLTLFVIEVSLCLAISMLVIYLLKPVLREILVETCGTSTRAEFWVMFTQLMLVISPLLIVIYFAPTQAGEAINMAEAMQQTLFRTLLGVFIALTMIAQVIWKSISGRAQIKANHTDLNPSTAALEK